MPRLKLISRVIATMILICAFALVSAKTYYAYSRYRYIPYGFDSYRMLGQTREYMANRMIGMDTGLRVTLLLFSALTAHIFHLPPSQTIVVPFLILNLGPFFLLFFLSLITSDWKSAVLSSLLFSIYSHTQYINNTNFFSWIITPLTLLSLINYQQRTRSIPKLLSLASITFFILISYLSYPITALALNIFIFFFLVIWVLTNQLPSQTASILILLQLLAWFSFVFIFKYLFPSESYPDIVQRAFSLGDIQVSKFLASYILTVFQGVQLLIAIIFLAKPLKLSRNISKLYKHVSRISKLSLFFQIYFIIVILQSSIPTYLSIVTTGIYSNQNTLSHLVTDSQLRLLLFYLVLVTTLNPHYWYKLKSSLQILTCITLAYILLYLYLPQSFISTTIHNLRFFTMFIPLVIIIVARGIYQFPKFKSAIVFSIVIPLGITFSTYTMVNRYPTGAYRPIISAMDWFVTQPDYTNVLFYADYYSASHVLAFEKIDGESFAGSTVPHQDQSMLSKCVYYEDLDCYLKFESYLKTHHIKYLVIENAVIKDQQEYLASLGELIYDQGIQIIKLW